MTAGKYLVIGGTGGIGRMLANRLVMKYHKVSRGEMGASTMRKRGRLMKCSPAIYVMMKICVLSAFKGRRRLV